jgi:hypothetical protein
VTGKDLTADELRALLLQFLASLTLCDHIGDVANDVDVVLRRLGIQWDWDDFRGLANHLGRAGVTTLYGSRIGRGGT